jgi:hypothetical protein
MGRTYSTAIQGLPYWYFARQTGLPSLQVIMTCVEAVTFIADLYEVIADP